jgi:uncharacterized membrane protein
MQAFISNTVQLYLSTALLYNNITIDSIPRIVLFISYIGIRFKCTHIMYNTVHKSDYIKFSYNMLRFLYKREIKF